MTATHHQPPGAPMRPTLQITVDCTDPRVLVAFWSTALGYVLEPPPGGATSWVSFWRSIGVPDGVRPRIWFQMVPEAKVVKNRVHLDLKVSGGRTVPLATRRDRVDAEVGRLTGLGATRLRTLGHEGMDYYGVVMHDPEGNEFCVA